LTKWPEAKAVPEATAEQTAIFIYEEIICWHGCLTKILSDRKTHFKNQMIEKLMEKFQIKHLFSTPYHPQTNELVEWYNRTLCEFLAKTAENEDEWDLLIAPVLFAYRTSKNATTKIEPFFLVYGKDVKLPIDDVSNKKHVTINNRIETLVDKIPYIHEKQEKE